MGELVMGALEIGASLMGAKVNGEDVFTEADLGAVPDATIIVHL